MLHHFPSSCLVESGQGPVSLSKLLDTAGVPSPACGTVTRGWASKILPLWLGGENLHHFTQWCG